MRIDKRKINRQRIPCQNGGVEKRQNALGWNSERILIMISWMKLMNRNYVEEIFVNVNLFIRTKWSEHSTSRRHQNVGCVCVCNVYAKTALIWYDDKKKPRKTGAFILSIGG